jgi:hypothetical protein
VIYKINKEEKMKKINKFIISFICCSIVGWMFL